MVDAVGDNVSWVDIANFAVGAAGLILTALLVVGAFLAYVYTKRQIRQTGEHHSEQLRYSLRPLIVVPHVECRVVTTDSGDHVELLAWMQNVGPGPAMNVQLVAWVEVPTAHWDSASDRRQQIDEFRASVDISRPQLTARLSALASGDKGPSPLIQDLPLEAVDYASQHGVLLYLAKYQNVFEDRFPSRPVEEWEVGHIEILPEGSWRA